MVPVEHHDSAESILSGRTKTSWQRLLYLPARSLYFCGWPGAKNNDVVPAIEFGVAAGGHTAVSAGECVSLSLSFPGRVRAIYTGGACACLKKYTTGREREKRRGAGRPALRRAPSECVNIQAARREGASERETERDKLALYIHGHPEFIRSRDSTRARYVTSVWNVESVSPDLMFLSRQDAYLTERGWDEKFDLCQVTRSRNRDGEKQGTSGFPATFIRKQKEWHERTKTDIYIRRVLYTWLLYMS